MNLEAELPVGAVFGCHHVVERLKLGIEGLFVDFEDFPNAPPSGMVHLLPLSASQLAVMIGEETRYHPLGRL